MNRIALGFILISACISGAWGATPAGPKMTTAGYVDTYFSYNPAGIAPEGRVFDLSDNTFRTALVGYSIAVDGERTAGRIDLVFGEAADVVGAGNEEHKMFQQAYATLKTGDASLDFGKFVTHLGYEVIPSKDNANLSRSYLFGYTIPFDHTGVRLSKPLGGGAKGMVCLVDSGWAAESSANTNKSFGFQVSAPLGGATAVVNGLYGTEEAGDVSAKRFVGELVLTRGFGVLSLGFDGVFTQEQDLSDDSVRVWGGAAGYASYAFAGDWTLSGRVEQLNAVDLWNQVDREGTLTLSKRIESLLVRAETRLDRAYDRDGNGTGAFSSSDPSRGRGSAQRTFALGAVYSF